MVTDLRRKTVLRVATVLAAILVLALTRPAGTDAFVPAGDAAAPSSFPEVRAALMQPVALEMVGREIVVGPGAEAATITQAMSLASDGDRIRVTPGTYFDTPIVIDRSIELIGEGFPILDGEGREGIITITAPNVVVRGFEVRNTGVSHVRDHAAIRVDEAPGCLIEGNRLEHSFFGIYLARAHGCIVRGNELQASGKTEASSGNGVHLWDVENAVVESNRIEGHRDGIYLEFARSATIRNNVSTNNLRYGLHFMFSDSSRYENNTFALNAAGVAVMYSRNVVMIGNRFADNWGTSAYGLLLKDVADSQITDNLFRQNTTAILADGTDRLLFNGNRIERNGWAVKIQASSQDNLFTENDFVDNTFDVVTNSRRSYNTFDGNYWSRYAGYDLTGDGIGDLPFRPVRLFSFIVETRPIAIVLLRSFFVDILDLAERVLPILTPEMLVDERPLLREVTR